MQKRLAIVFDHEIHRVLWHASKTGSWYQLVLPAVRSVETLVWETGSSVQSPVEVKIYGRIMGAVSCEGGGITSVPKLR